MQATPPSPQPVSEFPSLQLFAPLSQQPGQFEQMTGALPELDELEPEPPPLEPEELEPEPAPLLLELELEDRPPLELLELELEPVLLPLLPAPLLLLLPLLLLDDELEPLPIPLDDPASIVGKPLLVPASNPAAGPLSTGLRPPVAHATASVVMKKATKAPCRR